jgi:integrase
MFLGYVQHLETTARPRSARQARIILLGSRKGAGAAGAIGEHVLAADVKPSDIIPYLAAIHKRGSIVMARKARTYICAAFAFAMKSANSYTGKNGSGNWGVAINPGAAIPADRDAHRAGDRHLSVAEFRALWHWLESRDEISLTAPVLRLMMATGQRMEEILFLTDAQYDRTERLLDWSRTKNGQPHSIPLSPQAVTILDGLAVNRQGLFFPGRARDNAPLSMNAVEKELDRFIEKNGSQHFCPRDLRRTWKTLAGAAGLSKEIRDRLQNHARSDVSSRHYDRWTMLPEKRAAVAQWSEYLDWVLNGDLGEIEQGRGGQPVSLAEIRARREQAKAAA